MKYLFLGLLALSGCAAFENDAGPPIYMPHIDPYYANTLYDEGSHVVCYSTDLGGNCDTY